MKIETILSGACVAAALCLASGPSRAWEVIGGGPLPTFAATATPSAAPTSAANFTTGAGGDSFAYPNWNPGYSANFGKALVGVETKTGFAAGGDPWGMAAGFGYSRSSVKVGYDLGQFKPYVTAGFGATTAPGSGGANFTANAGVPTGVGNPFAPTTRTTTVGAGFDYAITDKLSVGMSVHAVQAQTTGPFLGH
jgi:hypothetical protein